MDPAFKKHVFQRVRFPGGAEAALRFAALLAFCVIGIPAYTPLERELPVDESEADVLLEEGTLDPALWQLLLPFYRRPLEVPSGELSQLGELFPDLAGRLPVDQSDLVRYLPWGTGEIRRFFKDNPILVRFKPLLQFDHHPSRRTGAASFYMNRSGYDTTAKHSARFLVTPLQQVSFNGTIDFTSDYARWERRSLLFKPASWLSMSLGNALLFPEQGLFYGYFPADTSSRIDLKSNWLYGGTRTWNGLALTCSVPPQKNSTFKPELSCFFHERASERIVGCHVAGTAKKMVTVSLGTSRLSLTDADTVSVYFHGSVQLRSSLFSSEAYCGIDYQHTSRIPFSWRTVFNNDARTIELYMIHLPARFCASRSSLLHRFENEMEFGDTFIAPISLVKIATGRHTRRPIQVQPELEIWFNETNVDHGTMYLKGEGTWQQLESTLLLSQDFGLDDDRGRRSSIQGWLEWSIAPPLVVATRHRCSFTDSGQWSYRGTVAPAIMLFSSIRVEPSVTFLMKGNGESSLLGKCSQKMTLFERMYSEFIFERHFIPPSYGGRFRVEGRASFFF